MNLDLFSHFEGEDVEDAVKSSSTNDSIAETGRGQLKRDVTVHQEETSTFGEERKRESTPASSTGVRKRESDSIEGGEKRSRYDNNNNGSSTHSIPSNTEMKTDSPRPKMRRAKLKGGVGTKSKNCHHEVALPPNSTLDADELVSATREPPTQLAKTYSFVLDPFQKQSVACIEYNHSVLVAAHTSAGKTAVAEYAVALSLKRKQRVIYTSPIKALSNQKYRDLVETFKDVGLMTGDVTINPSASCLVMTTEILRSMLYRGSEIMREVAWVIFDEVHYMRDRDRGVVWEESIIMLPHKVRFVFLSATIPNAFEFASWVAKVHDQPCHVIYTEYRPTPLEHFIFPVAGEGLHLVVDENGKFRERSFQKAVSALATTNLEQQLQDQARAKKRRQSKRQAGDDLYRIIKMIMQREYDPIIVFSFSKKDCETNALALAKLNMNTPEESDLVSQVFSSAMESLSVEDRKLPQITALLPLLKRGIGVHHGGLLPILKEVIEILFGENLLKCLFATETFAMGINMPAKTVVFTSTRKFDGKDFRWLNGGEYVQMAGRAGRRGLDDRGIVIQMLDEKIEQTQIKQILKGVADPLTSTFHLGYNQILNMLRIEDSDPEFMIRHSLFQFQKELRVPEIEERVASLKTELENVQIPTERAIDTESYCILEEQIVEQERIMRRVSSLPQFATPFLQLGRIVRVVDADEDWGYGVVVRFTRRGGDGRPAVPTKNEPTRDVVVGADRVPANVQMVVVDVVLRCRRESSGASSALTLMTRPRPCDPNAGNNAGEMRIVPVALHCIDTISVVRVRVAKDLERRERRQELWKSIREIRRRFPNNMPELDPINDMGIDSSTDAGRRYLRSQKRREDLRRRLGENALATATDEERGRLIGLHRQRVALTRQIAMLRAELKGSTALALTDKLRNMKRVMRRLGHVDESDIVQLKGRVACEINAADELLVTQLLFDGVFNDLHPNVAVALLAAFADTARAKDDGDDAAEILPEELRGPMRQLRETARRIAKVQEECKLDVDPEEYAKSFNEENVKIAYLWTDKNKTFANIMSETHQFEGSIVRMIRRLEELAREVAASCAALGSESLQKKFETGIGNIKRDIVFAASLYL